jgi:hypothetical protein
MIHALNPHGFAHFRRVNEDNVDLNRNFLDHSRAHPQNPAYDDLAHFIEPESAVSSYRVFVWPRLLWYKATGRVEELQQAISGGQYGHPEGLFFGGTSVTWSSRVLCSIVERHLTHAGRVIVIDFHTGLGEFGDYEVILQHPEGSATFRRAADMWGTEKTRTTHTRGDSDNEACSDEDALFSAELAGPIKLAFPNWLPEAEVTAVTVDFGTASPLKVFLAMRDENWVRRHGNPTTRRGRRAKMALREIFYPEDYDWSRMVWSGGKTVVEQAMSAW